MHLCQDRHTSLVVLFFIWRALKDGERVENSIKCWHPTHPLQYFQMANAVVLSKSSAKWAQKHFTKKKKKKKHSAQQAMTNNLAATLNHILL